MRLFVHGNGCSQCFFGMGLAEMNGTSSLLMFHALTEDNGDSPSRELTVVAAWNSVGDVAIAVIVVLVLSSVIICSNSLLLLAVQRFKRLRNPSTWFLVSLAAADLAVGCLLPFGLYFEVNRSNITAVTLCLFPYCIFVAVSGGSILSITAIAFDLYTSLATPLRYSTIVTHRSVVCYISVFWLYSVILGFTPLIFWFYHFPHHAYTEFCSFDTVIDQVRMFLFFALFAPCLLVVIFCYAYIYLITRCHTRSIFTVEILQVAPSEAQCGRTLLATVGLFLLAWLPFHVCMLFDILHRSDSQLLSGRTTFYIGVIALGNSAMNPWLYGYRNARFRVASLRILEDLLPKLSVSLRKHYPEWFNDEVCTNCASHGRLCHSHCHIVTTTDYMRTTYLQPPENTTVLVSGCSNPMTSPPYHLTDVDVEGL